MNKSYTLMTFNIPIHLKSIFDELSHLKHISKTSIINHLIETYCRQEHMKLQQDKKLKDLIYAIKIRHPDEPDNSPPRIPIVDDWEQDLRRL